MKEQTPHTIAGAIMAAFALAKRPMSLKELYELIVSNKLYTFKAKKPEQVLDIELRRRCSNIEMATAAKERPLKEIGNRTYQLPTSKSSRFNASDLEDARLVERAKKGDRSAYDRLFEKHHPYVFRRASLSVAHDVDKAKDIAQDIMLKAYERLDQYEIEYSFSTWLTKIANNHIIDAARRRQRKEDITLSLSGVTDTGEEHVPSIQIASDDMSPEDITIAEQNRRRLEGAIAKLKPAEQEALSMFYYEKLSYEEISARLNIAMGNLRVMIHRSKKNLRSMLEGAVA